MIRHCWPLNVEPTLQFTMTSTVDVRFYIPRIIANIKSAQSISTWFVFLKFLTKCEKNIHIFMKIVYNDISNLNWIYSVEKNILINLQSCFYHMKSHDQQFPTWGTRILEGYMAHLLEIRENNIGHCGNHKRFRLQRYSHAAQDTIVFMSTQYCVSVLMCAIMHTVGSMFS